ncbi:hypothetical protein Fcan01_27280 [Folsomia candida]|uniref:Uncharacterized protein n=1 Tax=Folsomia candida TaxID=158441 RepID=A0A226CY97_FOLCA|nr:hypothetical protein Fcan01_27280 [Folsomia candida]
MTFFGPEPDPESFGFLNFRSRTRTRTRTRNPNSHTPKSSHTPKNSPQNIDSTRRIDLMYLSDAYGGTGRANQITRCGGGTPNCAPEHTVVEHQVCGDAAQNGVFWCTIRGATATYVTKMVISSSFLMPENVAMMMMRRRLPECQAVQLLVYLYQDHYPFLYRWPFTLDKKSHYLVLLRDTRRGIGLLRKLVPTLVLLIMDILTVLDLYLPFPHHGSPAEDKALLINQTGLSFGENDEVISTSKLWVSIFYANLELISAVSAFCSCFLHLEDIVEGTNCMLKLRNLDTSFRSKLVTIYHSVKAGDDLLGSILIAFILSGWIMTPLSLLLIPLALNLDPFVHSVLYITKKYKSMRYTLLFLYNYLGAIPIGVIRSVFVMLTWCELSRVTLSIPTMDILWGEMELKNILQLKQMSKNILKSRIKQVGLHHVKLYRQVWLCSSLMRLVHGNFLFVMFSGVVMSLIMINFCLVRVATVMPAIMSATLLYCFVTTAAMLQILVTSCTRRNEELGEIVRRNREGAGMVDGKEGKMLRREVKSLPRGCLGVSFGDAFFGRFNKNSNVLFVDIIFSRTLDALIIYKGPVAAEAVGTAGDINIVG